MDLEFIRKVYVSFSVENKIFKFCGKRCKKNFSEKVLAKEKKKQRKVSRYYLYRLKIYRNFTLYLDGKILLLRLTEITDNVVDANTSVWTVCDEDLYENLDLTNLNANGKYYKDFENSAVLFACCENGFTKYTGAIGENFSAKAEGCVPENWHTEDQFYLLSKKRLKKLDKPLVTLYPKIIVIVEYNIFEALGENENETINYVTTFWNAVNLKYKEIPFPEVNVKVTGIIIEKEEEALSFIYESVIDYEEIKFLEGNTLLLLQSEYFQNDFDLKVGFKNYNATVTMLKLYSSSLGLGFVGTICHAKYNVAYVTDNGNFSGVMTAVHELGHLLGLDHDGSEISDVEYCEPYPSETTRTVMAPAANYVDKIIWSECSKKRLDHFSRSKSAKCLKCPRRHSRP